MNLQLLKRFPVTAGTCLTAIAVSLAYWSGGTIEWLTVDYRVWSGQIWRPLTATFPHVDPLHLIFNLYWTWLFGTRIEQVYGSARTAGLFAFLAAGSSLAEYDFGGQGVGLSGVGYGLFGFLWVLSHRDRRFWGLVDNRTVALFLGWFVLCVVLTVRDVWHIGNVAHGAGLILGLLAGWAVARHYHVRARLLCGAVLAGILVLLVVAGTVARPYLNFTEYAGYEFGAQGYDALKDGRYADAVTDFQLALRRRGGWHTWYNLGIAYQNSDQFEKAAEAYQQSFAIAGNEKNVKQALVNAKLYMARQARDVGDDEKVARLSEEVVAIDPGNDEAREILRPQGRTLPKVAHKSGDAQEEQLEVPK